MFGLDSRRAKIVFLGGVGIKLIDAASTWCAVDLVQSKTRSVSPGDELRAYLHVHHQTLPSLRLEGAQLEQWPLIRPVMGLLGFHLSLILLVALMAGIFWLLARLADGKKLFGFGCSDQLLFKPKLKINASGATLIQQIELRLTDTNVYLSCVGLVLAWFAFIDVLNVLEIVRML